MVTVAPTQDGSAAAKARRARDKERRDGLRSPEDECPYCGRDRPCNRTHLMVESRHCPYCPRPIFNPRRVTSCGYGDCVRLALNAAAVETQRRIREQQRAGLKPHRRERVEAAARRKPCSECGTKVKYNYTDQPLCRDCYPIVKGRERRRVNRRERIEAKLAAAVVGVTGKHMIVAGSCWDCRVGYVQVMYPNTTAVIGFCSRVCSRRNSILRRRAAIRASKQSLITERFDHLEVFNRDGWMCQLCREPVDRSLRVPHRLAATLDHVVPLNRGGNHTRRNVQLAHFICNSIKGDCLESELE